MYGVIVVVCGDFNFASVQLLDGMIAAVVSEFELESFAPTRDPGQLVAQTNSKDRLAAHEAADVVHGVGARLGVAGAVGEEDAVGLEGENVFGGSLRGDDRDFTGFTT